LMKPLRRSDNRRPEESFPQQIVRDFFEANDGRRMQALANCKCELEGCASRHHTLSENTINRIRNPEETYIIVLGYLCFVSHTGLIHKFIEKGYSDQKLHEHPLRREQLDELFGSHESEFDFCRFFMPTIGGPEQQQFFSAMQIVPFNSVRKLGGGGYGDVYQVKVLDRYCMFPDVKASYHILSCF